MMNKSSIKTCGLLFSGLIFLAACSEQPTPPRPAASVVPSPDGGAGAVVTERIQADEPPPVRAAPPVSLSPPPIPPHAVVQPAPPPSARELAAEREQRDILSGVDQLGFDPEDPISRKSLQQQLEQADAYREEMLRQAKMPPGDG